MRSTLDGGDRRGSPRVTARGSVIVDHHRAKITDVSASGVRVARCEPRAAYEVDESIGLMVRFDGARGRWWRTQGRVVRVEADGSVVVAFRDVPPGLVDAVRAELQDAADGEDVARVLVVDPDAGRRGRLAASFRAAGLRVTEAATPLDAIVCLSESRGYPHTVAIADTIPARVADELRTYLELEHADLALVRTPGDRR